MKNHQMLNEELEQMCKVTSSVPGGNEISDRKTE